jgi:peptide/nickel transport system permease protein
VVRMVLSRLVQAVPSLLGVTLIAIVLLQLSGDVTQLLLPMEASEEVRADFRRAYGLDRPIPVQYAHYLEHGLRVRARLEGQAFYSCGS